jgi:hypothetical protein
MREFLLGSGTPNLRLDLARIAVWFGLLAIVELLWLHDASARDLMFFVVLWTGITLLKHLYWHYRPPKVPPVTRYTNPRYNKHTLDK